MISADSIDDVLRTGTAALVVVPQPGGGVEYRFDPARPESRGARQLADDILQRARGRRDVVPYRDVTIRERGSRYIDFFVPGLLAMNIMGSSIWSLAFAIVTQRNKKLLKRLAATPMSRLEYLLSFVLSRLVFLGLEVAVLLGFGTMVLDVPIRGAMPTLLLMAFIGAAAFGAIGLLVSSRSRTIEGVSGLTNFVMLPMWIFSGVFFSSSQLSGGDSAGGAGAAAHRAREWTPGDHAAGCRRRGCAAAARGVERVSRGLPGDRPQNFPLAIAAGTVGAGLSVRAPGQTACWRDARSRAHRSAPG